MDQDFYLLAFNATQHCMQADKLAAGRYRAAVMPTPTEITSGCGFSLRFYQGTADELLAFAQELPSPGTLYRIGPMGAGGRRSAEPVMAAPTGVLPAKKEVLP